MPAPRDSGMAPVNDILTASDRAQLILGGVGLVAHISVRMTKF